MIAQQEGGGRPKSFPVEVEKKKWTRSKRYKKWVRTLKTKKAEIHHTKEEDMCVGKKTICKGDLGIPRKYMPQFNTSAEIREFTHFIKKVYDIKSCRKTKTALELRPSQGEINRARIKKLIEEKIFEKVIIPLIVSNDGYVVDGHHRWAAFRSEQPKKRIPVVMIDAPIKDVLGIAVAWGAKHQQF
jgi:hypothetical protein